MGKRLSLNEFIWLLILSGFSFYFSSLLLTGRISYYIHPKMILYVGFAAIIFTILAICQVSKLYNHHH